MRKKIKTKPSVEIEKLLERIVKEEFESEKKHIPPSYRLKWIDDKRKEMRDKAIIQYLDKILC